MDEHMRNVLRNLPSVDLLMGSAAIQAVKNDLGREVLVEAIRQALDEIRTALLAGRTDAGDEATVQASVAKRVGQLMAELNRPAYCRVINAAGIILHTALGRAVLPKRALEQIQAECAGYSLLQADPESGKRAPRDGAIERLLQRLTQTEAATVVNNNAAATSIVLNTVGQGKEVVVSRGQLVEIGGAFRLPDVMAFSGARLVEVGATNKTHLRDYEAAITEDTAAILRVHPSNYKIQGFTSEVPLEPLVELAHAHNLVMIDDVGAGSLVDMSQFGFEPEPTLMQSVAAGADIICCSADKLIGASQAGLILGKTDLIKRIRKNQFARIVRVDKLTLAVLEATLKLFLDTPTALREVPTLEMNTRPAHTLKANAEQMVAQVADKIAGHSVTAMAGFSQTGSGSLPTQNLATTLVAVKPTKLSAQELARRLRCHETPIFARIQDDQVLLDPRTLQAGEPEIVIQALIQILNDTK
jgi:L-seryl-tRNA(Ser) seleniumtransferase